jgi:hypothetical protein
MYNELAAACIETPSRRQAQRTAPVQFATLQTFLRLCLMLMPFALHSSTYAKLIMSIHRAKERELRLATFEN